MSDEQPEPVTVFVVTDGEYSDYHIRSIWTRREDAEREASRWGYVEEWVLNDRTERYVVRWKASLASDGRVVVDDKPVMMQEVEPSRAWRTSATSIYRGGINAVGYGKSPEHARKNLSDAVAKFEAEQAEI